MALSRYVFFGRTQTQVSHGSAAAKTVVNQQRVVSALIVDDQTRVAG